ncbi:MAG TPA: hypothetical protein VJZ71_13475 [Phycisphaerae bacterium]|nr:hypothetical protein [Phycisphaerae bacterium]
MTRRGLTLLLCLVAAPVFAQNYDLSWHTIDGGGTVTAGADGYELVGTIAQADADGDVAELTANGYSLVGGFWAAVAPHCTCLADVNADEKIDGGDIQRFLDCALADSGDCDCADLDRSGQIAPADVAVFVDTLLTEIQCP